MHRDFKIGLVVALALLLLIIVYFYVSGDEFEAPQEGAAPTASEARPPVGAVEVEGEEANEVEWTGELATAADVTADPKLTPTSAPVGAEPAAVKPEYEPIVAPSFEQPAPAVEIPKPYTPTATTRLVVRPVVPAVGPTVRRAEGRRIYIVREGDSGFWTVAEHVYGEGKHWPLIAKANPQVDTNALRPGQKLIIPPLPEGPPAGTAAVIAGFVPRSGQRLYTVKRGDQGFWGVAEKVYGHGKHWPLLRKANPSVDPYHLRPGQTLIVPPLSAARVPSETAGRAIITTAGRIYIVRAGDKGFWGIAKKMYGHSKYHELIANANKDVDPHQLRPGQKLMIPPLPKDYKAPSRPPKLPRPSATEAPVKDDRPIFD